MDKKSALILNNIPKKPNMVRNLVTLGPKGTDSENAARILMQHANIEGEIILTQSFKAAMEYSKTFGTNFLIPAAYTVKDNSGKISECWADINFQIEEEGVMELWYSKILPLKPICIAVRKYVSTIKTVALHAATEYFANIYFSNDTSREYFCNKPDAVKACSNMQTDACIGSLDIIKQYDNLKIEKTFESKMCWTIYKPKHNCII